MRPKRMCGVLCEARRGDGAEADATGRGCVWGHLGVVVGVVQQLADDFDFFGNLREGVDVCEEA